MKILKVIGIKMLDNLEEALKKKLRKLIDFERIEISFKVEQTEQKDKKTRLKYIITESRKGYQLEKKVGSKSKFTLTLQSTNELEYQRSLSNNDKNVFSQLFKRFNGDEIDGIRIQRMALKNPLLMECLKSSILANVSKHISAKKDALRRLHKLYREKKEEKFEDKIRESIIEAIVSQLIEKFESKDLPTPIFPTSVALSKRPNYYITEPKEDFSLKTKWELFKKLTDTICGKCGDSIYGLYIPPEIREVRDTLENYVDLFNNVNNIGKIAKVGRINLPEVGPFEYLFYLLDVALLEMFRKKEKYIPKSSVELFVIEKVGKSGRKQFFSHYIIPNLDEVYHKLYYGEKKYAEGHSKIKALISSFLVENWNIDNNLKENNSKTAHAYINRLLYHIFCHKRIDLDSILFLEDLKIKLGATTPIRFLDEVISWI